MACVRIGFQSHEHFESGHERHHHIQHDQVGRDLPRGLQRGSAVLYGHDIKSAVLQFVFDQMPYVDLILSNQDLLRHGQPWAVR